MRTNILNHLKKNDPVLYEWALRIPKLEKVVQRAEDEYFYRLVRAIINQQLSTKAAETIRGRFDELFGGKPIKPENTLLISQEQMRAVGVSNSKAIYIRGLAEAFTNKIVDITLFAAAENEVIITELTKIKGIGRWSAEMFLMNTMGREDVFSHGDLGLRRAIQKIYGFKKEPTEKQIEKIVKNWTPYKTYACIILWESLEI